MEYLINPAFRELEPFVATLPATFGAEGRLIYKARNELKTFTPAEGLTVVAKSFKTPHFINRIAYTFFRPSKAVRSYKYAVELKARGFFTPEPIACVQEFKGGLLERSYYVSTYIEAVTMRRDFNFIAPLGEETARVLKAFAAFTAQLHEAGIYHPDYSNGNILYRETGGGGFRFELVDLNRIKFRKVTPRAGWKNFHRLDFSLEMLEIVAREYALHRQLDVDESIARIRHYNLKTMKPYKSFGIEGGR
jgi:hypothetical protein